MPSAFAAPVALVASQRGSARFQIHSQNHLEISSPQSFRRRRSTGSDELKETGSGIARLFHRNSRSLLRRSSYITYTASPLVVTMSKRRLNETTSKPLTRRPSDAAPPAALPLKAANSTAGTKTPRSSRRISVAASRLVEAPTELSADALPSTTVEEPTISEVTFADVPWGAGTLFKVLGLWASGLVVLGTVVVPAAEQALNINEADAITHALMTLFRYTLIMGSGFWLLWDAVRPHMPLSRDLFDLSFDRYAARAGMFGFVWTIPLLRLASMLNEALVHGGQTELQQTAKLLVGTETDVLAISLFLLTMSVLAPVWEETMFRGFLIPSIAAMVRSAQPAAASPPTPTSTPTPTGTAGEGSAAPDGEGASGDGRWGLARLVSISLSHPSSPQALSVVGSSVIFSAAHGSAGHMIPLTALGLVLGYVYWNTRRLAAPIILHALWNTITVIGLLRLGPDGIQP